MKLSYRGVRYDSVSTPINMVESEGTGNYRGSNFHFTYPRHIPVRQPVLELKYRGVAYQTNATGGVESISPAIRAAKAAVRDVFRPSGMDQARSAIRARQEILSEVAKVHRQNIERSLQHRIEVARERGDQNLVNVLEREMQQIF
ncbi:DUF4278 domain-containing protein [Leptolyngbya sp. FACHB-671]|uniref:arginine synthesis PII-interacting regulator PirA n=1 Tax=Leptolyngbya sp. FACHB-671 TaxID=2692812 RepID=UPI001685AEE2|nr:DUF4278 domain-containing protein [Leptolyngbya sp. FACHB-671]MBD2072205.1 DUF4278 domain-containing protein [Leptolyngbya sp. FACHB-671]